MEPRAPFIAMRRGITRTVWLIGPWAVKFPSMRYGGTFALQGMSANLREARTWLEVCEGREYRRDKLNPVRWCSWLGLVQVQPRVLPLPKGEPAPCWAGDVTTDAKPCNFGRVPGTRRKVMTTRGRVDVWHEVCVDYA
jgi:hypothetical protein